MSQTSNILELIELAFRRVIDRDGKGVAAYNDKNNLRLIANELAKMAKERGPDPASVTKPV